MKTALVHGAAGFVSHSLLPRLISTDLNHFILVDRHPIPNKLLEQLKALGASVETYSRDSLLGINTNSEVALVICLAGSTDVDMALQDPGSAFESNLKIAIDLAEWLRQQREHPRCIYMSSDEVLGESFTPLPEDAPLSPTQPYAASKAAAEIVLHNYRDVYNLDIVTLRSCNLIGGQQRARKLIPITVENLLDSKPVPIYGNGEHQREWMAVEDLCEAILLLQNSAIPAGIYQAASGVHLAINEVVEIIARVMARPLLKRSVEGRLIHDKSYAMMTTRLSSLNWKPQISPIVAIERAAQEMTAWHALREYNFAQSA